MDWRGGSISVFKTILVLTWSYRKVLNSSKIGEGVFREWVHVCWAFWRWYPSLPFAVLITSLGQHFLGNSLARSFCYIQVRTTFLFARPPTRKLREVRQNITTQVCERRIKFNWILLQHGVRVVFTQKFYRFLKKILFTYLFLERGREGEREGEKH